MAGGVHGRGACMAGGVRGMGGHVWQGGVRGGGCMPCMPPPPGKYYNIW